MAEKRTFGWVQDPGKLTNLKKVVSIFVYGSDENAELRNTKLPLLLDYSLISQEDYDTFVSELSKEDISISYALLKGRGKGTGSRSEALCTGIVQAALEGQKAKTYTDNLGNETTMKRPFTSDWVADGFLRWGISCGLLDYDKASDSCKITDLGRRLVASPNESAQEAEVFTEALLSYPPVIRLLSLLMERDEQTKFELGSQLGFKGEMGFTSMPQDAYLCDFCEASPDEQTDVRSNEEGDSDKYARGIASWCIQMDWVTKAKKNITETYRRQTYTAELQTYTITRKGEKALIKARGNSRNPRLPRIVMFEMLASNKAPSANYLRYLRACIIKSFSNTAKSLEQLKEALKGYDIDIDTDTIKDQINGLISIGLEFSESAGKYKLLDKIEKLELPARTECIKDDVIDIKDRVRSKLSHLDHKYLILIDLAYSDAASKTKKNADAKEFEIQTADLFTKELSFTGMRLGGSNKPDVIISNGNYGTIIDNKSYKDGFNIDGGRRDEMGRYINENKRRDKTLNSNEWWKRFDPSISTFTFLFITSYLKGQFENQLAYLSNTYDGIKGAAIGVESLLYISEALKSGALTPDDFYNCFDNKEITYTI